MRAVVLDEYGGPERLQVREVNDPRPGPGELLVRLAATSVNPFDWKQRSGATRAFAPLRFPAILGHDASGEVLEVGPGVASFGRGDRVLGNPVPSAYAEKVAAPASVWARLPAGLDLVEAAALPAVGLTGAQLVDEAVSPRPGQTVLVAGAVGSVGRVAVYVARKRGARVLAGVRALQKASAAGLGAEGVVALDDDRELAALPELDALADTVGGETAARLVQKVKRGGVVGSVLGEPAGAKERGLVVHAIVAHGDARRLGELAEAMARGELVIPIARRFRLAEAAAAHALAERGGVGKVLLAP